MDLFFGFDCKLQDMLKMRMQGLAVVSANALASDKLNAGKFRVRGDLSILQPNRLQLEPNDGVRTVYEDNIFERLEYFNLGDTLVNYYIKRNETINFESKAVSVQYAPSDQTYVDVSITMKVNSQTFIYVPGFWQVMKMAWVQYFALFLLMYFLLYESLMNYVVTNNCFDTVEISEVDLSNCK